MTEQEQRNTPKAVFQNMKLEKQVKKEYHGGICVGETGSVSCLFWPLKGLPEAERTSRVCLL